MAIKTDNNNKVKIKNITKSSKNHSIKRNDCFIIFLSFSKKIISFYLIKKKNCNKKKRKFIKINLVPKGVHLEFIF